MDLSLPQRLQDYIEAEMNYNVLYRAMAELAPTKQEQQVFLEFAENERSQAQAFQEIYESITGQSYDPFVYPAEMDQPYQFALRRLLLNEHNRFQEYHSQFIRTDNNALKKACYQAGRNKAEHISKLIALMIE